MHKRTTVYSAITLALGGFSMSAQAALTSSATLSFDAGTPFVTSCTDGGNPLSGCNSTAGQVTDMGGSYFVMEGQGSDFENSENSDKYALSQFAPLHFGGTQLSSGQHTGAIDGSESPAIDNPWLFFNTTGMHTNKAPMLDLTGFGSIRSIDMAGWGMNFGRYGPGGLSGPTIPLAGIATLACSTASCSNTSSYTLDMDVHIPVVFTSLPYSLHLEGTISNPVPVPATVWLFGSGLVGLASMARRRRHKTSSQKHQLI